MTEEGVSLFFTLKFHITWVKMVLILSKSSSLKKFVQNPLDVHWKPAQKITKFQGNPSIPT